MTSIRIRSSVVCTYASSRTSANLFSIASFGSRTYLNMHPLLGQRTGSLRVAAAG